MLAFTAFGVAAVVSALIALAAAFLIENRSATMVRSQILAEGLTWVEVQADGLQIHLLGTAPNEAARYRVVNLTGSIVEASRIRDKMEVAPAKTVEAPRFSVEMLRNDDGIQLIGLLPEGQERETLATDAQALSPDIPLSDMLETAAYDAPEGWDKAFTYGVAALKLLPRSKISVAADHVAVTAIAASDNEKRLFEAELNRIKPEGIEVKVDISAPRPVLTPFTLRFVKDAEGARFDACSADSEKARMRILAAAQAAGVDGRANCTIGLGVPTPSWAEAAEAGIRAIDALGAGTITFSDADVTLLAAESVTQANFDRVVGELQTALPGVFSLDATLPKPATGVAQGPAEFTAVLAAETGKVELRGRVTDEMQRAAVDSFARARFGSSKVYVATRFDPELPDGWPVRVLAALESLSLLDNGSVLVRADTVEVKGVTGSQTAKAKISQILSGRLGQGKTFKVDVRYDKALDPIASIPTPEECVQDVDAVLAKQKITFTPGSAELDTAAGSVMSALASALKGCAAIKIEIAGHTDSQGSDQGNLSLSQARAEAVLLALQGRQVDVSGMVAKGYGETVPIADNKTEEGREANRRIEFTLISAVAAATAAQPQTPAQDDVANGTEAGVGAEDDSPSVAPEKMTLRPKARPEKLK
jgi:OOP family OmpA-OmpF porin